MPVIISRVNKGYDLGDIDHDVTKFRRIIMQQLLHHIEIVNDF